MFGWFKNTSKAVNSAVVSTMAVNCWRECSSEADTHVTKLRAVEYWQTAMRLFYEKWRKIHPASKDPQNILQQRCETFLSFIEGELIFAIWAGKFTDDELRKIGEFFATAMVRDLQEAILLDAERAAIIHDSLPTEWLEAA